MSEASPAAAALPAALGELLRPVTDVGARIQQVVQVQMLLQEEIDALTAKLQKATAQSVSPLSGNRVDSFMARLKQCRARIEALNRLLVTVKSRLVRVHSHLSSQRKATEQNNEAAAATMEETLSRAKVEKQQKQQEAEQQQKQQEAEQLQKQQEAEQLQKQQEAEQQQKQQEAEQQQKQQEAEQQQKQQEAERALHEHGPQLGYERPSSRGTGVSDDFFPRKGWLDGDSTGEEQPRARLEPQGSRFGRAQRLKHPCAVAVTRVEGRHAEWRAVRGSLKRNRR